MTTQHTMTAEKEVELIGSIAALMKDAVGRITPVMAQALVVTLVGYVEDSHGIEDAEDAIAWARRSLDDSGPRCV
jgi:hypothetical protein